MSIFAASPFVAPIPVGIAAAVAVTSSKIIENALASRQQAAPVAQAAETDAERKLRLKRARDARYKANKKAKAAAAIV